jgi:hypothetical protein
MSIISATEASAINDFVAILGCSTCANVTGASACQVALVNCQLPGGYGLELASRNLSGRIDGGVWQRMPNCVRLSLERNALTGTLPPALLARESPLRWLYLDDNAMSGPLPSMPASTQLEQLRVVNNRFDGTIPTSYFALPNIAQLHLSGNRFSGALPTPPVNTSQRLDNFLASRNQLTGTIGAEWLRLTRDKNLFFTAGSNRLSGTLPDLFATHTFAFFDVDNNLLSGTLPSSLSRQTALERLNVSRNMFSGAFVSPVVRKRGPTTPVCETFGNAFDSCVEESSGQGVLCCAGWTAKTASPLPASSATTTAFVGTSGWSTAMASSDASQTASDSALVSSTTVGQSSTTVAVPGAGAMPANAALIGGLIGGTCLLLLIAMLVGLFFLRGRARDRLEQVQPGASGAPPSQYSALPLERLYADVAAVRKPANQYDSPTSPLYTLSIPFLVFKPSAMIMLVSMFRTFVFIFLSVVHSRFAQTSACPKDWVAEGG